MHLDWNYKNNFTKITKKRNYSQKLQTFFGKFDVICFLVTIVLKFFLLPYYWRCARSDGLLSSPCWIHQSSCFSSQVCFSEWKCLHFFPHLIGFISWNKIFGLVTFNFLILGLCIVGNFNWNSQFYVLIMSRTHLRVKLHSVVACMSRNPLLETCQRTPCAISEVLVTATELEPT